MKLSHNGRSHRILRLMLDGPITGDEMEPTIGATSRSHRRKLWFLLASLRETGMIEWDQRHYRITRNGLAALAVLESGDCYHALDGHGATVRTFEAAA